MKIWLIWRTNVWKSTVFNRILWSFRAIVTDISGTTRELLQEDVVLWGKLATIVDSPWLENVKDEMKFIEQIVHESDMLLFVVDGKQELTEQEYLIRDLILENNKKDKTILIVNKLDSKVYWPDIDMLLADFYILGFPNLVPMSADQYEWLDLLDNEIHGLAKELDLVREKKKKVKHDGIPLAILWRPNVGKSTLLNKLVGEELSHVADKPWTTLDYITATFTREWKKIQLFDTAWIRKKKKIVWLERIAYSKTIDMLYYTKPVVVILVDVIEGMTHRDKTILGELIRMWLPIIIALNKIDLLEPHEADYVVDKIRTQAGFEWIPLVKISWKDWIALPKLLQAVSTVYREARQHVQTADINKVLQRAWLTSPPRFPKNKICKWKYITQVDDYPPVFNLSVNNKEYANFSFRRWVEKIIRKSYWFKGVPIKLSFTNKVETNPYLNR